MAQRRRDEPLTNLRTAQVEVDGADARVPRDELCRPDHHLGVVAYMGEEPKGKRFPAHTRTRGSGGKSKNANGG